MAIAVAPRPDGPVRRFPSGSLRGRSGTGREEAVLVGFTMGATVAEQGTVVQLGQVRRRLASD
jgi:hypothetical protein